MSDTPFNKSKVTIVDVPAESASETSLPAHNDCWDKIGVNGNGSCLELEKYIHCRNCPVYASAGLQLLNRPLPAEYRREWAEHFALPKRASVAGKISMVVFRVGFEWLALPASAFHEIAEHRPIHSLPHRRQRIVLGLANIRGELLICVSLSRLLDLERSAARERRALTLYDRLAVAKWDGNRFVFPVDEVYGVHRLHAEDLKEPPATVAKFSASLTRGIFEWQGKTAGLLDVETLFSTLNRNLS